MAPLITTARCLFGCLLIFLLSAAGATSAAESTLLEPGKTKERQFASGDTDAYQFRLSAGQYARINVFQRSINVAVECFGPDGRLLFNQDSHRIDDTEIVELIGDASGTYRLLVSAPDPHAPMGRYSITLAEVEQAGDRHRQRIAAARAFARGWKEMRVATREDMLKGIHRMEEAAALWRAAGDAWEEARTLLITGSLYGSYGDRQKAFDCVTRAIPVAQSVRDRRIEAWSYVDYAVVLNLFGDKKQAIEYASRGLPIMREVGDRAGEAFALDSLGHAHAQTGENRKAIADFEGAIRIFGEIQDRGMLSQAIGNLGAAYDNMGEYQRGIEYHQQKLALAREMELPASEALALNNIGSCYSGLGEYQKALDSYRASLEIARKIDNRSQTAVSLHNVASVYGSLGDRRRALEFYKQSLDLARGLSDRWAIANTLNNIGASYADSGDYSNALKIHQEALSYRRAVSDVTGEARSLDNIGKAYWKLGQREQARDPLERAVAISRQSGERLPLATALRDLGEFHLEGGDYERAGKCLEEALETSRAIQNRRGEAEALALLARLQFERGDAAAAHRRADEALASFEILRRGVVSPTLRASFFASARAVQDIDIEALLRLHRQHPGEGFDDQALAASERSRARSLLEMLGEGGREIRSGVDAGLLARERDLERSISTKAQRRVQLLSKEETAEAKAAAAELTELTAELDQIQSHIRAASPQYAALIQPSPLDAKEIQSKVLDGDTVLLEYALGTGKSFLWVVTPTSMDVVELAPRAEVEATARRVYELLTARNQNPARETAAGRAARIRKADEALGPVAAKASAMLLAPIAGKIEGKRLLIVGEGVLQYLPFGCLPEPGSPSAIPLIVKHEILSAPSASVVAVLREEISGRKPAGKAVAIFADPVFSAEDPRIESHGTTRTASSQTGDDFVRLRFSRTEADEIARLAPAEGTFKALDFDASVEAALQPELGQYRIVHFATHTVLNNEHPELSAVVLSMVDRAGKPRNGFLRLYDVYNLKLAADLVALSACQTGLGSEIKGEGLMGLTRGFLYAGAPRIVATLWEIDDRTTAEVMKRFYQGVLGRGERPAEALRAAQIAMWRNKGWDAPYYWAAFTLQGEWR